MKINTVIDDMQLLAADSLLAQYDGRITVNFYLNGENEDPLDLIVSFKPVEKTSDNPVKVVAKGTVMNMEIEVDNSLTGALKKSIEVARNDEEGATLQLNFRVSTQNNQVLFVYNLYEKSIPKTRRVKGKK